MSYVVAALYKFSSFPDYQDVQPILKDLCESHKIKGTLLLAAEGINGTVAGSRVAIDALKAYLESDLGFRDMEYKESFSDQPPFHRMKVRLKEEIVTIGDKTVDPTRKVGTYVNPEEWNDLISDPEVVLLDTRNDYEYKVGTFKNAIDPQTKTFREFPAFVRKNLDPKSAKKIAMFCTGGIRCEKASSHMLEAGFEEVYHLKGGILKYLETVPQSESLWSGECFVFDDRVTVDHQLAPGRYDMCHGCRMPITENDKNSSAYVPGVACPHCASTQTPEKRQRATERQKQIDLAKARGEKHIGDKF